MLLDKNFLYRLKSLRNCKIWNYYRDYFPISLVKTADLPAEKNYLFCIYPHGVASAAALLNFQSNANRFDELYPGIETHLAVLNANFRIPFSKDLWLSVGNYVGRLEYRTASRCTTFVCIFVI